MTNILDQARDAMTLENIASKLEQLEQKLENPKPKPKWRRILKSLTKAYFWAFAAIGFVLFVGVEETQQGWGFSGFNFVGAKDWHGLENVTISGMTAHALLSDFVLNSHPVGDIVFVLNPLMTWAVREYLKSSRAQIDGYWSRIKFNR